MKKLIEGVPVPPHGVFAFVLLYGGFCVATVSIGYAALSVMVMIGWLVCWSISVKKDPVTTKRMISMEARRGQENVFIWLCTLFLPFGWLVVVHDPARYQYNEPIGICGIAGGMGYFTFLAYEYWRQRIAKLPITSIQQ